MLQEVALILLTLWVHCLTDTAKLLQLQCWSCSMAVNLKSFRRGDISSCSIRALLLALWPLTCQRSKVQLHAILSMHDHGWECTQA